jgi:hypothetical protein
MSTTTITVQRTSVEKTGTSKDSGKAWTLYRLEDWRFEGARPAFLKNNVPFKTFDSLPVDSPVEVEIEEYQRNGGLQHYTVKLRGRRSRPKQPPQNNTAQATAVPVDDDRLQDLEERIALLEDLTLRMASKMRLESDV